MTNASPTTSATIRPLADADYAAWRPLAQGYKAFYRTPTTEAEVRAAWQRLQRGLPCWGFGAWQGGRLRGIAQGVCHASLWADEVCYLQDLYVDEAARGQGLAAALIDAAAALARGRGAARCYWLTHEGNARARALYDRVAEHRGFIRYDHRMG